MGIFVLAFSIGVVAGLRSLTAPAVVSWAARLGWIHLEGTPLAFLGHAVTPWIVSLLAAAELVADQLPRTPSRKTPGPFGARIVMGALSGAALGAAAGQAVGAAISGVLGAVAGTLGGYEARVRLARAAGRDLPIALLEDALAVGGGLLIVSRLF